MQINVSPAIALYSMTDGKPLSHNEVAETVKTLFLELGEEQPNLIPVLKYNAANKSCSIGIGGITDSKHIMPMFNFVSVPALQCEFSNRLKSRSIGFCELSRHHQKALKAFRNEYNGELAMFARFATLKVGTIGSRSTNHSMSYEIEIDYLPTEQILEALKDHVEIVNEDKRNANRSFGLSLTCRSEVEQFMQAVGLVDLYLSTITEIEIYQKQRKLKVQYEENGERVEDYKKQTCIRKVALAA